MSKTCENNSAKHQIQIINSIYYKLKSTKLKLRIFTRIQAISPFFYEAKKNYFLLKQDRKSSTYQDLL